MKRFELFGGAKEEKSSQEAAIEMVADQIRKTKGDIVLVFPNGTSSYPQGVNDDAKVSREVKDLLKAVEKSGRHIGGGHSGSTWGYALWDGIKASGRQMTEQRDGEGEDGKVTITLHAK